MQNKKLDQKVQHDIEQSVLRNSQPGYGIVVEYNEEENTAMVLMAKQGSDAPGEIFANVPCPTHLGVQTVDPEVGRPCWVEFRDGLQASPVITHFFHHSHAEMEYGTQYRAENQIPRFMMEL